MKDAVLDYTSTGSAVTTVLSPFGTTAKIELWSAGTSVVQNLTIEGRQAIRDASERVTAEDAASQVAYGRKAGSVVTSLCWSISVPWRCATKVICSGAVQ